MVGKVSVHPEKVSTGTKVGLDPCVPGFSSVESISQWAPGLVPLLSGAFFLGLVISVGELAGEALLLNGVCDLRPGPSESRSFLSPSASSSRVLSSWWKLVSSLGTNPFSNAV